MFKDFSKPWPEPERHEPPPKPRVSRREEAVLLWLLGFAFMLMLFGPFAGASLIDLLRFVLDR